MAHTQNFEFCNARAEEAAADAREATLDNVRDRALRSEKTWRGLAEYARGVAVGRENLRAEKAAAAETEV